ncbi:MAG TPA: hypothetical protein VKG67_06475, partial [Gallionellaceae bacterium]|nr:hypothetical protein [Gallionellaceae bacterium]
MKKISSKYLFLTKHVFPVLWFAILAFVVIMMMMDGVYEKAPLAVVVPCLMAIFGYFLMKKLVWDLADEVYDCGDFLLVRNRGEEERVPFTEIVNVSSSLLINPPRVTLRLAKPGKFGDDISFSPVRPWLINPFARNQMVEDLIVRIDRARAKRLSSNS